jgi:molybdate transport system substrate-binding protein
MRALLHALPLVALSVPTTAGPVAPTSTLTVYAAASLTDAFRELGRTLERTHPGLVVRFNFAGSQQLALQIEQGAPADVFASADRRWMSDVEAKGLLAGEAAVFARNRLVAIVPRANPGRIDRLEDLARPGTKLVLAAEPVPAGRYSRETLAKLGRGQGFPDGYERRVLANVVSQEENVKSVVAKVQLGEADAGIAYRSDVTRSVAPHVRVLEIPEPYNSVATYPIAVLKTAHDAKAARDFVALVTSPDGQAVLQRHGLLPSAGAGRHSATGTLP